MRICFISAGEIEVPPKNWGALENVVWNLSMELWKLGHEIKIVNEKDSYETYKQVVAFKPDIVHLHYGNHYELMPSFHCRKIVTSYDGTFEASHAFHDMVTRKYFYDCEFMLLRDYEKEFFLRIGISPRMINVLPLGVRTRDFPYSMKSPKIGKSIYLGKIDSRKRQYDFQGKDLDIDFVGPNASEKFDESDECYLGVWTQKEKCEKLGKYGNLVLLSVSENGNPPLVCLEAMAAGLGIVVSEASNEGLDLDRKFITVIPEDKITDYDYLRNAIKENREYSVKNRLEIIEYVEKRDWFNIAKIYNSYL